MKSVIFFKRILLILILISFTNNAYSKNNPRLVLLPLSGTGLSLAEKQAYQAALEDSLSNQYEVFSGSQVIEALKKQTQFECTAESCMENIAIEFQGELVARGTVDSKHENSYILVIKIRNVFNDKVILSKSQGCSPCKINDVISTLKQMISGKKSEIPVIIQGQNFVSGPSQSKVIRITPEISGDIYSSVAMVIIESEPDQADVFLGDTLSGQTPYTMQNLKAGQTLQFTLKKINYYPKTFEVTLKGGINDFKTIYLKPMFGTLVIKSKPSGADVFIAGKHAGKTPYINEKQKSGAVLVSVKKELYKSIENQRIIIKDEKTTTKNYQLKPNFGVLIVESDPDSSDVKLYGSKGQPVITDKTPCTIKTKPGKYKLKISHSGYEDLIYKVNIANNTTKRISKKEARLRLESGQVIVSSNPFKRGASIYIDDEIKGKVPGTFQLPVGRYTVKVKYKNMSGSQKIYVKDRKTINVNVELNRKSNEFITDEWGLPGEIYSDSTRVKGKTFTNSIDMTFVYIKPGTFMMGSPSDEPYRGSDEIQHKVTITKGYYLQTTEVTQRQWKKIMGNNPSHFSSCGDNCPVESVSWDDVQEFIKKLNRKESTTRYRLPTEAEWEYAARAGSTTAFANGAITEKQCGYDSNLSKMGWYCGNSCVSYNGWDCSGWSKYGRNKKCSNCGTHPVGKKQFNKWGLYDMHGNVWEWCQDRHGDYPTHAVKDPAGPDSGGLRVLRGGSWSDDASYCRSASRGRYEPGIWYGYCGVRLAAFPVQQGR